MSIKRKKFFFWLGLMLLGMTYFIGFSGLEISPFLKGYVGIIPAQALALLYIIYFRWNYPEKG